MRRKYRCKFEIISFHLEKCLNKFSIIIKAENISGDIYNNSTKLTHGEYQTLFRAVMRQFFVQALVIQEAKFFVMDGM